MSITAGPSGYNGTSFNMNLLTCSDLFFFFSVLLCLWVIVGIYCSCGKWSWLQTLFCSINVSVLNFWIATIKAVGECSVVAACIFSVSTAYVSVVRSGFYCQLMAMHELILEYTMQGMNTTSDTQLGLPFEFVEIVKVVFLGIKLSQPPFMFAVNFICTIYHEILSFENQN